jgi:hypothetical protein
LGELGTLMHKSSSCQEGGCGILGDMGMSMQKRSQELLSCDVVATGNHAVDPLHAPITHPHEFLSPCVLTTEIK